MGSGKECKSSPTRYCVESSTIQSSVAVDSGSALKAAESHTHTCQQNGLYIANGPNSNRNRLSCPTLTVTGSNSDLERGGAGVQRAAKQFEHNTAKRTGALARDGDVHPAHLRCKRSVSLRLWAISRAVSCVSGHETRGPLYESCVHTLQMGELTLEMRMFAIGASVSTLERRGRCWSYLSLVRQRPRCTRGLVRIMSLR